MRCDVWYIFGSLLFLSYANSLKVTSNLLDSTMFAGYTDRFYSSKNLGNLLYRKNFRGFATFDHFQENVCL